MQRAARVMWTVHGTSRNLRRGPPGRCRRRSHAVANRGNHGTERGRESGGSELVGARATTTSGSRRDRGTQVHAVMWTARMMWTARSTIRKVRRGRSGRWCAVANRGDDGTEQGC